LIGVQALHTLFDEPWPHIIVDYFLDPHVLTTSILDISEAQHVFDIEARGTGCIEYSVLTSKTLWRALYTRNVITLLSDAFSADVSLNNHNMIQVRRMNDHTPEFPLHNDFVADAPTIASFLYLSPGWVQSCGGCLRLYDQNHKQTMKKSIAPIQNRFV